MPSLAPRYPLYLGGAPILDGPTLDVEDKWTGDVGTRVTIADRAVVDRAIEMAVRARGAMRRLKPFERQQILQHCVSRFEARKDELAHALCVEAGKPIRDARGEVTRLVDTFRVAAEEATRIGGEVIPMEISARAKGYRGMTQHVPIGACAFISPFNFPLNLVAHKVAPAIAAGCPFVLKPASHTPIGALIIAEVLAETNVPEGAFSVLPATRDAADLLVTDERLALLSFTGSPAVGWDMKTRAGRKKVVLELGGNAAVIVDEDAAGEIDDALDRIVTGAFYQSGQSCISVQRICVHRAIYAQFRDALVER
ncbi:MAG: aldehyde dehydrogenase family protein, partial [Myxococcales bacterium]|nr:aldehyde dehydrogenase family protein [Myxococcales bacterium]